MKLNNKGFAITGILYTVFVLFLMILLSVLGGLNIKRKSLEKNMENIKEDLEEKCVNYTENPINAIGHTTSEGKYILLLNGTEYETYFQKEITLTNDILTNATYIKDEYKPSDFTEAKITKICTTNEIE